MPNATSNLVLNDVNDEMRHERSETTMADDNGKAQTEAPISPLMLKTICELQLVAYNPAIEPGLRQATILNSRQMKAAIMAYGA